MATDTALEKRRLRRQCFSGIKALSEAERSAAGSSICREIADSIEFQQASTVAAYLPLASEPDLNQLFTDHPEKNWAFSRVLSDEAMEFRQVDPKKFSTHLFAGEFGILEPEPQLCPIIDPGTVDLVIVPGVGFCPETGNRLGRGKGHYDRYLATILQHRGSNPPLFGVCFKVQLCSVHAESHDVPMSRIISG